MVIETGVKIDPMYGEVNLDKEERYYEEQTASQSGCRIRAK